MRERELIDWIRARTPDAGPTVPIGPGDDTAMVLAGDQPVLVTVDQVLDGVHVQLAQAGGRLVGRKAMARNLSDIAAMAGSPLCAVVSVALPANCDETTAREIQAGLSEMGESTGCPLVGGDVGVWPGALAVTVTVLGRPGAGGPIRRRGGRPGDTLVVTGRLGGAWRTDRHLTFTPRLTEARALVDAAGGGVHAMIDLSDGLATDLHHICRESGCAAELHAPAIPIHPDARHAGEGQDALQAALTDGEDYELLLAVAPDQADALLASPPIEAELTAVGRLVAGEGITLVDPGGRATPLTPGGWEHGR